MGERGRTGGDAGAREERSGAPATWGGWRGKLHSFYGGGGGVGAELCTQTECHVSITIIFILIIFVSQAAANELFCFCPV
jgi:hypothetical protein